MTNYVFDRVKGGLTQPKVEKIINAAGYNAKDFIYNVLDKDRVMATGEEVMNVNKLENAAKKLNIKGVTVTTAIGDLVKAERDEPKIVTLHATANLLGATDYGINIRMDQETVNALTDGDFSLYGFKGVQTAIGGGAPLVWFQTNSYGLSTDVEWEVQYQAYTSLSQIIPNGRITGMNAYNINLGQQFRVESPSGTGGVFKGETPLGIEVLNETTTRFTCGISQLVRGEANALCAFPLYGLHLDAFVPIEKVLLSFASRQVNTGTVIEKAFSPSILVDLTSANQRSIVYDINDGWDWGGAGWAQSIAANSELIPLLIEQQTTAARTLLDVASPLRKKVV